MCLIGLAWHAHPRFKLVIAANRDEFRARPTSPARFWPEHPELLAGRDLVAGGTWLGVTKRGRFAALTNIRDPARRQEAPRSRGELVVRCLTDSTVSHPKQDYGGFNLLFGDLAKDVLSFDGNHDDQSPFALSPGVYGLSNGTLDDPWPKTLALKGWMSELLHDAALQRETLAVGLFEGLATRGTFADQQLPDTGIGLQRERVLSSVFIDSPDYGTRSSTVITVDLEGTVTFEERTFDAPGNIARYVFSYSKSRSGA